MHPIDGQIVILSCLLCCIHTTVTLGFKKTTLCPLFLTLSTLEASKKRAEQQVNKSNGWNIPLLPYESIP